MIELLFASGENKIRRTVHTFQNPVLKFWHGTILRKGSGALAIRTPPLGVGPFTGPDYSISRRLFFRFLLRANACLTRNFSPGFK